MKDQPKKYKWSWGVDQRAILESGFNIDIIDFSIFRMLLDFSSAESCQTMTEHGTTFYMFRWKLVKNQMPILNLNTRQSVKKRIDKLVACEILIPHKFNQQNRTSWFTFGIGRDILLGEKCKPKLPTDNESLQESNKIGKPKLPTDNNGSPMCQQSFTHTDNESLHYTTTSNNIDNNTYTPAAKIGDIKTNIPEGWPTDLKKVVIEFLNYRQSLPKRDRVKTQTGWDRKISRITNDLKKQGLNILIAAINQTIEKEWKEYKFEYLFNEYPELNAATPPPSPEQDGHKLPENEEKAYLKRVADIHQRTGGRISYFNRTEFSSWLKGGHNFEKWRDRGMLGTEISKKIKNTITYLSTSTFAQQLRGRLSDYVESAFAGNIKELK